MATGICYTWSGPKKRYEDKVSISLEKGNYDLPTIKNDVLSVANENHYSFEVSSHYKLHSKGNYRGDMPLVFVTYYPDSGKTPCYFNFDYNTHTLTIYLYLLTPNSSGGRVFKYINYSLNGSSESHIRRNELDDFSKKTLNMTYKDEITFYYNDYKSRNNIANKLYNNYLVNSLGLKTESLLTYYNTDSSITDDMFVLYHKLNGVTYTNGWGDKNITINNITEDSIAYLYVVPKYIYVHPVHGGFSNNALSSNIKDATNFIWEDTENSGRDGYAQFKMSCSGRSHNTGGNYDNGPWGAPKNDGGNRTDFNKVYYPIGCVRYSENNRNKEDYYNYHLGVKLTTSLYEYKPNKSNNDLGTVCRNVYLDPNNAKYFTYNGLCDNKLETLNNSPYPSNSYYGDTTNFIPRYIEPYNTYIGTSDNNLRGNLGVTYAKQFPQNNTYIALDRITPDNSNKEPATTMPPQFWVSPKINYWGEFVKAQKDKFGINYFAPPMILQGLICGGSGNHRNHESLGLFSAISLRGKNKNPNKLVFHAESYATYYDDNVRYNGTQTVNQPFNSYIITGRIKTGGQSSSEGPIWQKFRFNIINNIDKWIEEYG